MSADYIDALLWGYSWNGYAQPVYGQPATITYSFLNSVPDYYPVSTITPTDFDSFNGVQIGAALAAFGAWASVANLTFVPVIQDGSTLGQITFGLTSDVSGGEAFRPFGDQATAPYSGDVWINNSASFSNPLPGSYEYSTIVHEIGHALGLKHPFDDGGKSPPPYLTSNANELYTVMAYAPNPYDASWHATGPMLYDIAAIQYLYGANFAYNATDTTYAISSTGIEYKAIWDGDGIDTIDAQLTTTSNWIDLMPGGSSSIGTGDINHKNISVAFLYQDHGWIENAIGGSEQDSIAGNLRDNRLEGGAGFDDLTGFEGNDLLYGGAGADTLDGGEGNDELHGDDDGTTASSDRLEGGIDFDTYYAGAGDTISDVDGLGTVLLADVTLNGGSRLQGETNYVGGGHTYSWSGGSLVIDGSVTVETFNNGDLLINLVTDGTDADDFLTGTLDRDFLEGFGGNDFLVGFSGDDVLNGGKGNDTLAGALGDDVLNGGEGNDVLSGDSVGLSGSDTLNGGGGDDYFEGNGGNDTYVFDAGFGRDTIWDEAGDLDTVKLPVGVVAADVIVNRHGVDAVLSLPSGDTITFSYWYYFEFIHNIEKVEFADGTVWGVNEIFTNVFRGTENADILGSSNEDDVLLGLGGDDELFGDAGNDTLDGGLGLDTMAGGPGDDVYVVDDFREWIYEAVDGGTDTVYASVSYTLPLNIERLVLTGSDAIDGTGSSLDDVLTGNSAANVLTGFTGNDTYVVDNAGDVVIEGAGEGSDTVESSITYTLVANVENLTLTGTDEISGTGNDLNNIILGNGGSNTLSGGAGDDIIDGDSGADSLAGGIGTDVLKGGDGADYLADWEGTNFLSGGTGDDYLYADGVPDILENENSFVVGGPGNDWVDSFAVGNVIAFNPGDGQDTVYARNALTLSLGGGIEPSALSMSQDGTDLVLAIGTSDSIRLTRQFEVDPEAWPEITLQMFGSVHLYDFNAVIADFQAAHAADPSLVEFSLDGVLQAHETSVSSTEALGGALAYQYGTVGSLNGVNDAAIHQVLADANFGTAPQSIVVPEGNQAPILVNAIFDQFATEDAAFSFVVPANTFRDIDLGDTLNYSATRTDDSALPAWLAFDALTRTFSGTAANEDVGVIGVKVTATDVQNASVSDVFDLAVTNTNDAPWLAQPLADLTTTERQAFSFVVPEATFSDVDAGDSLAYTAALASGAALPSWLAFEASSRSFSGTPGEYDIGTFGIQVTATDQSGAQAADEFNLSVTVLAGVTLSGTSGQDTLIGGPGADTISAGAGADKLYGNEGQDVLNGGDGADELYSGTGNDTLNGGAGADTMFGDEGADTLNGELGADVLWGGTGNDTLDGGDGGDTLRGEAGEDLLYGDIGADKLYGGIGNDYLSGGLGGDELFGEGGNDVMQGGDGADSLIGGTGNDLLQAGLGGDTLDGGEGDDTLIGGAGADKLSGGGGDDLFVFDSMSGSDRITDFADGASGDQDLVDLRSFSTDFSALNFSVGPGGATMTVDGVPGVSLLFEGYVSAASFGADDFWFS